MTKTPIQLRWNDMDMLGHLYNGKYQHLYDLGLSQFFNEVLNASYQLGKGGVWPLKVSTTINYLDQVHFDQPLEVRTFTLKIGTKSITFAQQLIRTDTQKIMSDSTTTVVCFNTEAEQSVEVPEQWRKWLENEIENQKS